MIIALDQFQGKPMECSKSVKCNFKCVLSSMEDSISKLKSFAKNEINSDIFLLIKFRKHEISWPIIMNYI